MNEQLVNTTTAGTQYLQTHILLEDGHLIAWVSRDHDAIYGQRFDTSFQKKGEEILLFQGDPNISTPDDPQLFSTSSGFGLMFRPSDGNLYVKLFSHLNEELISHKRVNASAISNMQSDAQWGVVEVSDGYLVVWAGNDGGAQHEDIFAQRIDGDLERVGDRFTISEPADHSKFNPCIFKDSRGIIVAWSSRPQNTDGSFSSRVCVRRFNDHCEPISDCIVINPNDDYQYAARFVQINASRDGYIVLWKAGYTNAWAMELDTALQSLSEHSTEIIPGASMALKYVHGYDGEFATIGYASSGQDVVMQRYQINGDPIGDKFVVNDDQNEEFYDDGGTLWPIPGGYVAIWNSVKLGESYEIYAKRLIYGEPDATPTATILVDNHVRFTAFKADVSNLVQDIADIQTVRDRVDEWISKGINLTDAATPLATQQQEWVDYLEGCIEVLKNAFLQLKTHDDRITSSELVIFEQDVFSALPPNSKAEYLCNLFEQLHSNVCEEIARLAEIGDNIDGFTELGVRLGDARQIVTDQKSTLESALRDTCLQFDDVLNDLKVKKEEVSVDSATDVSST